MKKQSKMSLRERAALAWQDECAKRTSWAGELRQEIEELFGASCSVEIELNGARRPVAKIEGLQFILNIHSEDGVETFRHLMLLSNCSKCNRDTGLDINNLADLGRWLEVLEKQPGEYCSGCISLPQRIMENKNSNHAGFQM